MSNNQTFLTPCTLLVDNHFCCEETSFQDLYNALLVVQKLPITGEGVAKMGELSDLGGLTIMYKLGQIAEKCQEIQASTGMLRVYYQHILTVCDQTLTVASTAEADYDVIFNGLEEIFNNPGNQTLQDRVDTTIKCRLDNITLLAHAAQGTTDGIKEGTVQTIDYQLTLRTLSDELSSSEIQNKLRGILYSEEELQHDLGGLVKIQNFLAEQNMKDQSAASISNLEILLGAVSAISSDLSSLRESIQESAQPGPELLLDMDKATLLELWTHLADEVQKFKDQYQVKF